MPFFVKYVIKGVTTIEELDIERCQMMPVCR